MFSTPRREYYSQQEFAGFKIAINDETDLIEVVNKLQNKLAASGKIFHVSLPQIVVVGCQSAGKSSVLESIIRREFLPRGTGTVTRRPTIIQLHTHEEVFAEFLHKENVKFTNFEDVKKEIAEETLREPGPTGFSTKPITLKIFAPDVLKLTFVDMPGIIKVAVGDLTEDSIDDVNNMILKYIEQPNSLILAVSPANADIATSDALNIAKKVDPDGDRTIGVLTKLDLMDHGTNARELLENRTLYLQRGYVGVLNRSQLDIDEGKDLQFSQQKEKRFFENHPAYSHMVNAMGSPYLEKLLHVQLKEHIRKTLPALRKDLSLKLNAMRQALKKLDLMMGLNNNSTGGVQAYMLKLIQQFIDEFHIKLFGNSATVNMEKLESGAVINCKLYTDLQKILALPALLTEQELTILTANQHGIRNIISLHSMALEAACGSLLKQYKKPLESYVDSVADILVTAVDDSTNKIRDYPLLKNELLRYISDSISKATEETKDLIGKHLKSQMMCCNIYHWDFKSSNFTCENGLPYSPIKLWSSPRETISCEDSSGNSSCSSNYGSIEEERDVSAEHVSDKLKENEKAKGNSRKLSSFVQDYMHLVQKQIGDNTMKYVITFLVQGVSEFVKAELIVKLLISPNLKSLVEECEQDFEMRNNMLQTCTDLEEALFAVHSF